MMDTDDMQRLHRLLVEYQRTLQESTERWARCNLVLLDLTEELMNREYARKSASR